MSQTPRLIALASVGGLLIAGALTGPAAAQEGGEVFLDSAISIDRAAGTVTLPLHEGTHDGDPVWFVVTESSDSEDASQRGINHAPKLANALGTEAVQRVEVNGDSVDFTGTVDFAPERIVIPGPEGFPPEEVQPGAVGDADYSPLITPDGETVLNASQVANATGEHDAIVTIDYDAGEVTLDALAGFYEDEHVLYLHQEASVELVAAIEGSTFAPKLNAAPGVGSNAADSARSAIIPVVNGVLGVDEPDRQGLQSALLGEGDPLNITQSEPVEDDYSPLWDVTPAVWTDAAIETGQRVLLTDHADVAQAAEDGLLTSAGTGPANESLGGLQALPGISNCPLIVSFGTADAAVGPVPEGGVDAGGGDSQGGESPLFTVGGVLLGGALLTAVLAWRRRGQNPSRST